MSAGCSVSKVEAMDLGPIIHFNGKMGEKLKKFFSEFLFI